MFLMDVAADLNTLGGVIKTDVAAWGAAILGVALVGMAVTWVLRLAKG